MTLRLKRPLGRPLEDEEVDDVLPDSLPPLLLSPLALSCSWMVSCCVADTCAHVPSIQSVTFRTTGLAMQSAVAMNCMHGLKGPVSWLWAISVGSGPWLPVQHAFRRQSKACSWGLGSNSSPRT